jgi:hypothetical protein
MPNGRWTLDLRLSGLETIDARINSVESVGHRHPVSTDQHSNNSDCGCDPRPKHPFAGEFRYRRFSGGYVAFDFRDIGFDVFGSFV